MVRMNNLVWFNKANIFSLVIVLAVSGASHFLESEIPGATTTVSKPVLSGTPTAERNSSTQTESAKSKNATTSTITSTEAYNQYLEDMYNPFSMNFAGTEKADQLTTMEFTSACRLADELGEIEKAVFEDLNDIQRCEKTIIRSGYGDRIQIEVMAFQGKTENIAATIWIKNHMSAHEAILNYEQILQFLAYQFSSDTLDDDIYGIENKNQIHFKSSGGGFVGALSFSYAHLQFSYSR